MKYNFLKGIIYENPVFVLLLGLCSILAVTTNLENGIVMGFSVMFVLFFTNTIVAIISKIVPGPVKLPVYILIIATFVTIVELLLKAYLPIIYTTLGIYIPLIVVNCIVLGRALGYASKNNIFNSMIDGLGYGLGFLLALMILGSIREIIGNNTITIMDNLTKLTGYRMVYHVLPNSDLLPMNIFIQPAGAFLTLGILIGIFKTISIHRRDSK